MKRLISLLFLLVVMVFAVAVAVVNADPVTVNYYFGTTQLPLSVVLALALIIGALLAALVSSMALMNMRRKLFQANRLAQKLKKASINSMPVSANK